MKVQLKTIKSRIVGALLIVVILIAGGLIYRSKHMNVVNDSGSNYNSRALMTVTTSGGYCATECLHPVYNLYDNGTFEGHTKLSSAELSKLKDVISSTDFTKYTKVTNPDQTANIKIKCESYVDGVDQVLLFPQKSGSTSYTPCMMNIPDGDPSFSYINKIIDDHYIQEK